MTLLEIYNKHKKGDWPDKNDTHSYVPVYEEIFAPYRITALNVLEIGLMSGESLRMWQEYFNNDLRSTHCNVYGIDCDVKPINGLADLTQAINDGLKVCIGDAESEKDIKYFFEGIKFDVVIEDATHNILQQVKIYNVLKPYLNEYAIYIIEDVQSIDTTKDFFENIDSEKQITILDRRHIKNRYDDVLVIITDKK